MGSPRRPLATSRSAAGSRCCSCTGSGCAPRTGRLSVGRLAGGLFRRPNRADAVDFRGVDLRAWYTNLLTGCLDALGLGAVHLIGHSQGAMQARWLALDAPARVRSVVAIGTPAVAFGARVDAVRLLARPGLGRLLLACRRGRRRVPPHPGGDHGARRGAPTRTSCARRTGPPTAPATRRRSRATSGRCSAGWRRPAPVRARGRRAAVPRLAGAGLWGAADTGSSRSGGAGPGGAAAPRPLRARRGRPRALARRPRRVHPAHRGLPFGPGAGARRCGPSNGTAGRRRVPLTDELDRSARAGRRAVTILRPAKIRLRQGVTPPG